MLLRAVPELAAATPAISEPALRIPGAHRIPMANGMADIAGAMPPGMTATIAKGSALTERDDVLVRLNSALARETLKLEIRSRVDAGGPYRSPQRRAGRRMSTTACICSSPTAAGRR